MFNIAKIVFIGVSFIALNNRELIWNNTFIHMSSIRIALSVTLIIRQQPTNIAIDKAKTTFDIKQEIKGQILAARRLIAVTRAPLK